MNWLFKYWAKIGGLFAIGVLISVVRSDLILTSIGSLLWLYLAALLLHQFEEYVFPGGFKVYFNQHIRGKNRILRFPLNNYGMIMVNVIFGWISYLISALAGAELPGLAIGLLGVTIVNGLMHSTMFLVLKKYNPGFVTGLFIFIPFGVYVFLKLLKTASIEHIILGIIIFVFGNALIPMSIYITSKINVARDS